MRWVRMQLLHGRPFRAPQRAVGHMGPITHPDLVNAEIDAFLQRHR